MKMAFAMTVHSITAEMKSCEHVWIDHVRFDDDIFIRCEKCGIRKSVFIAITEASKEF